MFSNKYFATSFLFNGYKNCNTTDFKKAISGVCRCMIIGDIIISTPYCSFAFVNDKVRFNRWGRIKIRAALSEKRLPRELVNEAIDNINEEEYMSALAEVIAAKRRELKGKDDYAAQQKIMRYAAGRGYEPSLIMKAINYCGDEMDF